MKIAEVTHVFLPNIGGVEYYVYRLSRDLSARGEEVEILTTDFGVGKFGRLIDQKFTTKYFNAFPIILRNPFPLCLAWHLLNNEYDVIHCHSILAFPSIIAVLLRKNARIITTAHGVSPENPKGLLKIIWVCYAPLVKFLCHKSDKIIVLGAIEKEKLKKSFNIDPLKIEAIPNGIDIPVEPPTESIKTFIEKYGLKNNKIILFVGRITSNKNPELLLKIFSRIRQNKDGIKLILVGPVDLHYRQYLKKIVKELSIGDDVIFTGELKKEDIDIFYKLADLFISLGVWEGIPTTMLEAMYFGVPCVMYNAGSIKDIIANGENGFISDKLDGVAITDKVLELLENESLRQKVGMNAHKTIVDKYIWHNSFEKIYSLYGPPARGVP